jgi:hypothetical protein
MDRTSLTASSTLTVALTLCLVAGGDSAAEETSWSVTQAVTAARCPKPADIETAIGVPAVARTSTSDFCMYELTGKHRGVFTTLWFQPATRAEDVFADLRKRVKVKGSAAQPDRLSVGEGGWGYSSGGRSEAAVVSKGRLYHVEIDDSQLGDLTLPKDAAVRLIEVAMRAAPAAPASASGGSSAALDACTLANNAEVSEIAEERPEFAKYWSAPVASYGGSHCDYDGGSIRVYQGKDAGAALESTLKAYKADQQPRTSVAGLGDKAFFMIPNPDDEYNRLGLLAVFTGPRVLQLTLDAHGKEPIEATRPRLERLARLVLPRLR